MEKLLRRKPIKKKKRQLVKPRKGPLKKNKRKKPFFMNSFWRKFQREKKAKTIDLRPKPKPVGKVQKLARRPPAKRPMKTKNYPPKTSKVELYKEFQKKVKDCSFDTRMECVLIAV